MGFSLGFRLGLGSGGGAGFPTFNIYKDGDIVWTFSEAMQPATVTNVGDGSGSFELYNETDTAWVAGALSTSDNIQWTFNPTSDFAINDRLTLHLKDTILTVAGSTSYEGPFEVKYNVINRLPEMATFTIDAASADANIGILTATGTDPDTDTLTFGVTATDDSSTVTLWQNEAAWQGSGFDTGLPEGTDETVTLYCFAKDSFGGISLASLSDTCAVDIPDTTAPVMTAFTVEPTSADANIEILTLLATDNVGVASYQVNEVATIPDAGVGTWQSAAAWIAAGFDSSATGTETITVYAWAKDAAANVSAAPTISDTCDVSIAASVDWLLSNNVSLTATVGDDAVSGGTSVTNARVWDATAGLVIVQEDAGEFVSEGMRRTGVGVYVNNDGSGNKLTPSKTGSNGEEIMLLYPYWSAIAYSLGDVIYVTGTDNHNYALTVTIAGSSASMPSVAKTDIGSTVTDGVVTYSVDSYYTNIATPTVNYLTHVLNEPSATNELLYSQEMDNAIWGKLAAGTGTAPVITPNYAVAPDGTTTADRAVFANGSPTTASDFSLLSQQVSGAGSHNSSVFLKSTSGADQTLIFFFPSLSAGLGEITVTSEWQRVDREAVTSSVAYCRLGLRGTFGSENSSADVLVWQADLVAASTVSSPIPTTTGTVTRDATDFSSARVITEQFLRIRVADIQSQTYVGDGTNELAYDLATTTLTFTDGTTTLTNVEALAVADTICLDQTDGKLYVNGVLKDTDGALAPTWSAVTAISNGTDIYESSSLDPTDTTWDDPE